MSVGTPSGILSCTGLGSFVWGRDSWSSYDRAAGRTVSRSARGSCRWSRREIGPWSRSRARRSLWNQTCLCRGHWQPSRHSSTCENPCWSIVRTTIRQLASGLSNSCPVLLVRSVTAVGLGRSWFKIWTSIAPSHWLIAREVACRLTD